MEFNKLYPVLPVGGPCWAITLKDTSGRDIGGCISPELEGLLLQKADDGKYSISTFQFSSSRGWDARDRWENTAGSYGEPEVLAEVPAFVWRNTYSAYHHDSDHATAEVEVVRSPTSEWLLTEMRAIFPELQISPEQAVEFLSGLEYAPIHQSTGGTYDPFWGESVWEQRARMDIRTMFLRFLKELPNGDLEATHLIREFTDSREPRLQEIPGRPGTWWLIADKQVMRVGGEPLVFSSREVLRWKRAFNRVHDSKLNS